MCGASGFWGDSPLPLDEQRANGQIDDATYQAVQQKGDDPSFLGRLFGTQITVTTRPQDASTMSGKTGYTVTSHTPIFEKLTSWVGGTASWLGFGLIVVAGILILALIAIILKEVRG